MEAFVSPNSIPAVPLLPFFNLPSPPPTGAGGRTSCPNYEKDSIIGAVLIPIFAVSFFAPVEALGLILYSSKK